MLGSNKAFLTASLLARLSLGVSSDWESAAQATGLRRGKCSSAAFFSVRCLVTSSCRKHGHKVGDRVSLASCAAQCLSRAVAITTSQLLAEVRLYLYWIRSAQRLQLGLCQHGCHYKSSL